MKKIKAVIWLIIIGLLGLVMFQNRDFFLAKRSLGIDLISTQYRSPEIPIALYFLALFLFGWLIAYLFALADRFRSVKTIKRLQQTIQSQRNDIDGMRKDVEALKPKIEPPGADAAPEQNSGDESTVAS